MRLLRSAWLLAAIGACGSANAHSPIPGIGQFYNGMLHPALVPAHLMAIVALGLWLGQRWPAGLEALTALVLAFPAGALMGLASGWQKAELVVLGLAAAIALATVTARAAPRALLLAAGAGLGFTLGADSIPDGLSGSPRWVFLSGAWLGVLVGLSWILLVSEAARQPWMKIGLRVVASWVGAAAILVLALTCLGPRPNAQSSAAPAPSALVR